MGEIVTAKITDAAQAAIAEFLRGLPESSAGAGLIYSHRVGLSRAILNATLPAAHIAGLKEARDLLVAELARETDAPATNAAMAISGRIAELEGE